MTQYVCDNCGKSFTRKTSLKNHIKNSVCLEKKYKCEYCCGSFSTRSGLTTHWRLVCREKNKQLILMTKNSDNSITDCEKSICDDIDHFANDDFAHDDFAHDEHVGDQTKIIKDLKKTITDQKKIISDLLETNKTLANSIAKKTFSETGAINNSIIEQMNTGVIDNRIIEQINTGTINNNFTLIAFGKEDLAKFSQKQLAKILDKRMYASVGYTDIVHFNPEYPEFHNIFIQDLKNKYAMEYSGKKWNAVMADKLIDKLYERAKIFVEQYLREHGNSLSNGQKNALNRFIELEDDHDKVREIKDAIKLSLYNGREMSLESKRISENNSDNNIPKKGIVKHVSIKNN
jgi:hypothetical protein